MSWLLTLPVRGAATGSRPVTLERHDQSFRVTAWTDGKPRIGIHTSIAGSIFDSLDRAHQLGCNAVQIFSASPRMWPRPVRPRVTPQDAELFRKRRTTLGLDPLVIHDNYLINLASPDLVLRANSIRTFHDELRRAVALGADYLVAHPGNSRGSDRAKAIEDIVQALRLAALRLELSPGCGGLRILLENTSGQGTAIGSRFEELKAVLDACPELPLGVCLDTAHMFEAGYDIRKPEGLEKTLEAIGRTIGFERVFVIHVNDSKTPLGSRVDRHEQIGRGHIGLEAFRRILNHPLLAGRAFILETPIDKPGDDRRNVRTLWKLVGGTPRQIAAKDGFPAAQRRHRRRLPAA